MIFPEPVPDDDLSRSHETSDVVRQLQPRLVIIEISPDHASRGIASVTGPSWYVQSPWPGCDTTADWFSTTKLILRASAPSLGCTKTFNVAVPSPEATPSTT